MDNARQTARKLRKRWALASTMLLPFAFSAGAQAETLEDALAAAHRNNPNLEEARLAVRAAREDRVQARAGYLPSVDIAASYGARDLEIDHEGEPSQNTNLVPSTASARITQPIYTGGRLGAQSRISRAGYEAAGHALRNTEQEVLLDTVVAYAGVRRYEEVLRLRGEYVEGLDQQRIGTQRRLEVGEVTRTDLAQAEARLAGARALLAGAHADYEAAMARYMEVVGVTPEALAPAPPPPEAPLTLHDAVSMAEMYHPLIQQARESEKAAKARVGLERSALLPQFNAVGRYDHSQDDIFIDETRDSTSVMAEVSIPLFEGGYAWSRTAQSRINARRARASLEATRRQVVANVVAAWNDLTASRAVLTAADEQVGAADAAVRGARREQGLGLRSTIDVLDAERELQEAKISRAGAEAEAVVASYALLAAVGGLSMEGLGLSVGAP